MKTKRLKGMVLEDDDQLTVDDMQNALNKIDPLVRPVIDAFVTSMERMSGQYTAKQQILIARLVIENIAGTILVHFKLNGFEDLDPVWEHMMPNREEVEEILKMKLADRSTDETESPTLQ